MFRSFFLTLIFCISLCSAQFAMSDLVYTSAEFSNRVVITNNATTYEIQSDIIQSGVKVGTLTARMTYGGGTNPFANHSWSIGSSMQINGDSTTSDEDNETADGLWEMTITPETGYVVRGMTLFSDGTILGNPTIANFTTNGTGTTLWDGNQGLSNELIANFDDGDSIANGSNISFNAGSSATGIEIADHSQLWSLDSAGATSMSFNWQAGPVAGVGREGIRFDASFSAVPEPTAAAILGMLGIITTLRRRRKN